MKAVDLDKGEICRNYRHAKYKSEQIQILAELYAIDRAEVIDILINEGEKVRIPVLGRKNRLAVHEMTDEEYIKALFKRLDTIDEKIRPLEREYKEVIKVLESYGTETAAAAVKSDIRMLERLWECSDENKIAQMLDMITDLRQRLKKIQKAAVTVVRGYAVKK